MDDLVWITTTPPMFRVTLRVEEGRLAIDIQRVEPATTADKTAVA